MDKWEVFMTLTVLVSFLAVIIKPIIELTKSITKLTATTDEFSKDLKEFSLKNTDSHKKIWEHNQKQDEQLNEHEQRLIVLEYKDEGKAALKSR